MNKLNSFINKQIELFFNQTKKHKKERVYNIYFWPSCKVVKLNKGDVTLSTSLFMFQLIPFSPHFIVHLSCQFRHSTLYCSCFISFPSVRTSLIMFHFISFSPQSISFISPITVDLAHTYLIWLCSYYMIIQPYCQFHFSTNPVSGN